MYSIGATLYHLLTGQVPYVEPGDRISARTILSRVQSGPPRPIAEIRPEAPKELLTICERAMARNIPERHASMHALAQDLRGYFERDVQRTQTTLTESKSLYTLSLLL